MVPQAKKAAQAKASTQVRHTSTTHSAATLKGARLPKKQRYFRSSIKAVALMLSSHRRGIKYAFGLTCEAFFPCALPEAVPCLAGGAPGVVAEASPQGGLPRHLHPHPDPLSVSERNCSALGPQQSHSPSFCLFSWTGKVSAQEKSAGSW